MKENTLRAAVLHVRYRVATLAALPFTRFAFPWGDLDIAGGDGRVVVDPVLPPAPPPDAPVTSVGGSSGILQLLADILVWVAVVFWIAAIGFVLYAAFLYLTAAGNTERTSKANKQLTFAVVAMIIGIIAYALPGIVEDFLFGGSFP